MATLQELEARLRHLETKVQRLVQVVDYSGRPYEERVLQADLTQEQEAAVHALLERTQRSIREGNGPSRDEFLMALNDIKPVQPEDDREARAFHYHAGGVAEFLCNTRRYQEVGEYLKEKDVKF